MINNNLHILSAHLYIILMWELLIAVHLSSHRSQRLQVRKLLHLGRDLHIAPSLCQVEAPGPGTWRSGGEPKFGLAQSTQSRPVYDN